MMETSITDFHTSLYIPEIKKLDFHLPHVFILGDHHCGNTLREALKCHMLFQDMLCLCEYAK